MKHGPRYRVPFRRRRMGKTDFRKRKKLLTSKLPRAVVRNSNRYTRVQFATFSLKGDLVVASAISKELKSFGWKHSNGTTPAAYLTGFLAGKRASKAGLKKAVLDVGRHNPSRGSKVFASLKGMVDAGIDVPHSEEILPSEDRIKGKHLDEKIEADFDKVMKKLEAE
ncbi:MAG: 50S ribosomal protein L18 [Methanobacteriota archaeon]|nr:MAG: 50S ribosomal protein L18 [Euryarchaeota archaeon]